MTASLSCPACGVSAEDPPIHACTYRYRVCGHCGHAHLDPIPPADPVRDIYDKAYFRGGANFGYLDYGADEAVHRRNARHRLRLIGQSVHDPGGKLLDFGCAYGYFLAEAGRSGWETWGVEISAWARQEATKVTKACVVPLLEDLLPDHAGTFDLVCFFQVLEHCREPLQVLRTAHALLKPEGHVVLETWDKESGVAQAFGNRWQQISPPSVIHLFTRSSLSEMMKRSGFESPTIRATSKYMSLGTVTSLLTQKVTSLSRVPGWDIIKKATKTLPLPYFLPDLIFASAAKRLVPHDVSEQPAFAPFPEFQTSDPRD